MTTAQESSVTVELPTDQDASGRSLGLEELALLESVIESGRLFAPKGSMVKRLESDFADFTGAGHAVACSSGSAAIHVAVAAIDPEPGDEVVTTPITDMGALMPILYQGAIPVFADVDPLTGTVTADTVAARISARTKAIVVTHLFGQPADVAEIASVAAEHGIPLIEDCAQAFGATVDGHHVGTMGSIGTFSLQQGKHITAGEGGLVVTSDPETARHARLYVNKAWDYDEGSCDHDFLALNYRMTELQGAVAVAQLSKLAKGVAARRANADRLSDALSDVGGITVPSPSAGVEHSYWRYPLIVDPEVVPGGPGAVATELKSLGIPSAPRYIKKPAFGCGIFRTQKTLGTSRFPFDRARPDALDYSPDRYPGAYRYLDQVLVLGWNERMDSTHVDALAEGIRAAVATITKETS